MSIDVNERSHNEEIQRLVSGAQKDVERVISSLQDSMGRFIVDEGPLHDYKEEFPFSQSDGYFGGILRLICAFHNSYGGVIIFGVHDKLRTAGKNKVLVDSEKVNRKLREDLSRPLQIATSTLETPSGEVQVLIVPPRPAMHPPIYSRKAYGDYKAGTVYIRKGAEVLTAIGSDLPYLYGDRSDAFMDRGVSDFSVSASLPPSPATIQEFVGRFVAIERICDWVTESRDPRMFLWGQGGSGKSTIAYEFCGIAAQSGKLLRNKSGHTLDRVIFISGKSVYLNPHTSKVETVALRDFSDATDAFKSILLLSKWEDAEKVRGYTYHECLDALEQLFDIETQLIVIDDIDTLTTAGRDGGMEELFSILSRSKSGTKVLYTQRSFPSFAQNAALEVPSLNADELKQFTDLCCEKFKVIGPVGDERSWISQHSEGRPLAVETIVGMRRVTPNYKEAFRRWTENSSEPLHYLFSREYQQLNRDDRSRHVLAALSILDGPQGFEVLRDILQFSAEQLEDAIADCRDMFLRVSSGPSGAGDLYSIGPATRLFVMEASRQLDRYASIEARVKIFQAKSNTTPAAFIPLIGRASRNIELGNPQDAINLLRKEDLPFAFREHPEVKAILGQAYAALNPPNVLDARACFDSAFTLGHRHYGMYIAWLELEKANRTEIVNGIQICEKVVASDGFDLRTRATFRKRLARYQALRANDLDLTSPHESSKLRDDSVISNIEAYADAVLGQDFLINSYRERADSAISIGLRRHLRVDDTDGFFDLIERVLSLDALLDEFAATLATRTGEVLTRKDASVRVVVSRLNRLSNLVKGLTSSRLSVENRKFLADVIKMSIGSLTQKPANS